MGRDIVHGLFCVWLATMVLHGHHHDAVRYCMGISSTGKRLAAWIHTVRVTFGQTCMRTSSRGAGWRPNQILPCMMKDASALGVEGHAKQLVLCAWVGELSRHETWPVRDGRWRTHGEER
jgi:hypothetical protein